MGAAQPCQCPRAGATPSSAVTAPQARLCSTRGAIDGEGEKFLFNLTQFRAFWVTPPSSHSSLKLPRWERAWRARAVMGNSFGAGLCGNGVGEAQDGNWVKEELHVGFGIFSLFLLPQFLPSISPFFPPVSFSRVHTWICLQSDTSKVSFYSCGYGARGLGLYPRLYPRSSNHLASLG